MAMNSLKNKPLAISNEVIKMSLIRAKMCESLAIRIGKKGEQSSFFLAGMLSLMDNLLERPLEVILGELPLESEIKAALLSKTRNDYSFALDLVEFLEKTEWEKIFLICNEFGLDVRDIFELYGQAIEWSRVVVSGES